MLVRSAVLALLVLAAGCDGADQQDPPQTAEVTQSPPPRDEASRPAPLPLPWFELEPRPNTLSEVMRAELTRLGPDNPGYRMQAGAELCAAMSDADLPCDYNARYALVQFLAANGKPVLSTTGMWSYTGRPNENQRLADAVQRNLSLFQNDLTSEEVQSSWR